MKAAEFFGKIFGDKEIDIDEITSNRGAQPPKTDTDQSDTPVRLPNDQGNTTSANSQDSQIAELQKQIEELKVANKALLDGSTVQKTDKSIESLIYSLVGGKKKEE